MAVYFVYRCGYLGPTCLHRRRFDDATVLDWFRRHWVGVSPEDEAIAHAERVLGTDVAYFACVFLAIARESLPLPETTEAVAAAIGSGYHDVITFEDHCVQVLTDDDVIDMAYYFFDDDFLSAHGDLTAYLLRDDWRLPDGEAEGWSPKGQIRPGMDGLRGDGPGCLYLAWLDLHGGEVLRDGFAVLDLRGVRLPDLCRWVMGLPERTAEDCGYYFWRLREVLFGEDLGESDEERAFLAALRADPGDALTWGVYSDWLAERGMGAPGIRLLERALPRVKGWSSSDPTRNLTQTGGHVAQAFLYCGDDYRFDHWFLFDDLWGGAHPALADALIRYTRWDVLSTGSETRWE